MKIDLAARRKEKGLTQAELGAEIGIAQRTVAAYESGERRPSVDVAKRLAEALDFSWAELFEGDDEEEERKDET